MNTQYIENIEVNCKNLKMSYYPPPGFIYPPYPPPPGTLSGNAPPPVPYPYQYYVPGTVMIPVPIGPMPDQAQNPTYVTNYIYHGHHGASNEAPNQPAITDEVSVVECSGDFDWVPTTATTANHLTGRAVVGGHEGWDGSPLWIIRTWHEGGLHPGKLAVRHSSATIPYEGKEVSVQNIEVLCAQPENLRWIAAANGNVPPGAISAGKTASGEALYVGRARYQLSVTPGAVIPSKNSCVISFAGTEVTHKMYDVLCRAS